jgi:hypothetical protein
MSGSTPTLNEAYFFVGFNFQRPSSVKLFDSFRHPP